LFSPGTMVSFTNKTEINDITEITTFLKLTLRPINDKTYLQNDEKE